MKFHTNVDIFLPSLINAPWRLLIKKAEPSTALLLVCSRVFSKKKS